MKSQEYSIAGKHAFIIADEETHKIIATSFLFRDNPKTPPPYILNEEYKYKSSEAVPTYPTGIISTISEHGKAKWFTDADNNLLYLDWCKERFGAGDKIHSVKNSSGETLTVGDNTNKGTIQEFKAFDTTIFAYFTDHNPPVVHNLSTINTVHPAPPPLLTHDGHQMKDLELIYKLYPDFHYERFPYFQQGFGANEQDCTYFFSDEKMNQYIFDNQKIFSRNDIKEAIVGKSNEYPNNNYKIIDKNKLNF